MSPPFRVDPSFRAKLVLAREEWLQPMRSLWWEKGDIVPPALRDEAANAAEIVGPLVDGRRVALIGNAASLLAHPPEGIDGYDLIVRINRGAEVAERAGTLGTRTDIVLVAGRRMAINLAVDRRNLRHPPAHMLFMGTSDRPRLPGWLVRRMSFYPAAWHDVLKAELGASPSTGAMGIDLLSRLVGEGTIDLYGFDFWGSPTSYNDRLKVGPHAPRSEREFAERRVGAARIHTPGVPEAAGASDTPATAQE